VTDLPPLDGQLELLHALRGVVGSRIVGVRYLVPVGTRWPDGREDGPVHEVDQGVELVLADGSALSVQWLMQGEDEFLSIAPMSNSGVRAGTLLDAFDVSEAPEWTGILGRTVNGIGAAWHVPNAGRPRSVWALRINLDGGSSFVIALGEVREGNPAYLPDSMVVLFNREDAEAYRIGGSATSAWGESVPAS
jgi:hypothetical protein